MDENIYANVGQGKYFKTRSIITNKGTASRTEKRRLYCVIVLLGLLCAFLLCWLIALGAHHGFSMWRSAANLTKTKGQLTTERDLLSASLTQSIQKQNSKCGHSKYKTCGEACPAGWRMFGCSCYLLSNKSNSWRKSRADCRTRGAHLVVVDSPEEQTFLSGLTEARTLLWIGLTDSVTEGTWRWVDGRPLTLSFWRDQQPDNGDGDERLGEEDCAHITTGTNSANNWHDLTCNTSLRWICEKVALHGK